MDVQVCPTCCVTVLPSSDGICPSCRSSVNVVVKPAATSPTAVGIDGALQYRVDEVGDAVFNPYAPPRSNDVDHSLQHEAQASGRLSWLLFSFTGRIPRRTYWGVLLGATAALYALLFLLLWGLALRKTPALVVVLPVYALYIWITLATQAKRWHDNNKSGWWTLITFVPVVGPLWAFVELGCLRGTIGDNRFGPDPT